MLKEQAACKLQCVIHAEILAGPVNKFVSTIYESFKIYT